MWDSPLYCKKKNIRTSVYFSHLSSISVFSYCIYHILVQWYVYRDKIYKDVHIYGHVKIVLNLGNGRVRKVEITREQYCSIEIQCELHVIKHFLVSHIKKVKRNS